MSSPFGDARHLAPEATAARQSIPPVAPAPDGKAAVEGHFGWAYRHFARELPGRTASDGAAPTTAATGAATAGDGTGSLTVASVVRALPPLARRLPSRIWLEMAARPRSSNVPCGGCSVTSTDTEPAHTCRGLSLSPSVPLWLYAGVSARQREQRHRRARGRCLHTAVCMITVF